MGKLKNLKLYEEFQDEEFAKPDEWEGIDRSLEESLYEYGQIAKYDYDENQWYVIYKISDDEFGVDPAMTEKELDNIVLGKEWADEDKIKGFLSYVGMEKDEWLDLPFIVKLNDLSSYFGYLEIYGTDYSPMSKEELIEKFPFLSE